MLTFFSSDYSGRFQNVGVLLGTSRSWAKPLPVFQGSPLALLPPSLQFFVLHVDRMWTNLLVLCSDVFAPPSIARCLLDYILAICTGNYLSYLQLPWVSHFHKGIFSFQTSPGEAEASEGVPKGNFMHNSLFPLHPSQAHLAFKTPAIERLPRSPFRRSSFNNNADFLWLGSK